MTKFFVSTVAVVLSCVLLGCQGFESKQQEYADTILFNGRIYTVNEQQAWAEAVAIKNGRYVFLGSSDEVKKWRSATTELVDLQGKMLMPGINDAHSHPFGGGVGILYNCDFEFSSTPAQIAKILSACVKSRPKAKWLEGGQWTSDFFQLHNVGEPRLFLDAVSTEVAIYLEDDSGHNAWVNSRALALAGIDKDTRNPDGGTIVRNAQGEASGVLQETAAQMITRIIPPRSVDEYAQALKISLAILNRYGVTASNEARTPERVLQAYVQIDLAGQLSAHITTSLQTPFGGLSEDRFSLEKLQAWRNKNQSPHVDTSFVKIFLDGVPTASRSALMLDDYTVDASHPNKTKGGSHLDQKMLNEVLSQLDQAGFTVKIHTAGDGSVRMALDAITAVRQENGNSGLAHRLAHAGYIHPDDMPRFKALNVIADFSPYIWFPSPITDSVVNAVGQPRGEQYFPAKTLLAMGAPLLTGSDWPSAVETPNPWPGIESIISRQNPFAVEKYENQSFWLEQRISLPQALKLFTLSNARAMKLAHKSGSIEIGKSADFIVLNHNLFEIPVENISDTEVLATWFEGKQVYSKP